ncbi:LysR substrate-binding domain-containing protein [Paraburkholderia sp. SARCC-3016]|uniref:LysR substrate-binding domain-containing protein n=1 Tax=Paraburkholderia sp. SARCC-3016 TaxID=3058611 RepID=UPI002807C418|nr:LysR substrate-binding domain-containing protein [Paraburkholderia sp. SARCC-3016]MDQ7978454.1 LysR substrate-binding domain-containing protein [Paraburkholderia sp. SARCC-3016]
MDLRRIRYFVVLAETLHFGRAALSLNIAQPPLSQQIRVLEQELGARLFERSNRRVELTPAGKALLPEARALLAQADRTSTVAARAQRGEIGELRVGLTGSAIFTVVIPRLILTYRQRFPGVRLRIDELTTQEQLNALLQQQLDVAIVRSVSTPDLPPTLRATRLLEDSLVVALPAQHRLAGVSRPLPIGALADEAFVMYPRDSGTGVYDQIIMLCRQAGFAPTIAQEAHAMATIVGLVAAGLGVAVVPDSLRSIGANGVVYRPLKEKGARSAMWLVLQTRQPSPQAASFAAVSKMV